MRATAALALLALAACSPKAQAPVAAAFTLDCAKGFEPLAGAIAADPALKAAPDGPEPYRYFNALDGKTSYVVTKPGADAHPAILEQKVARENGAKVMKNAGCSWGDKAGYDELVRYYEAIAAQRVS